MLKHTGLPSIAAHRSMMTMKMKTFFTLAACIGLALAMPAASQVRLEVSARVVINQTPVQLPFSHVSSKQDHTSDEQDNVFLNHGRLNQQPLLPPSSTSAVTSKVNAGAATCTSLIPSNPSTFWYSSIGHDGTSPFIGNPNWKVHRNVHSDPAYAADNSGNSDASKAIQKAINDGPRNTNSLGTTGQPAVVYVPGGTYRLDTPLQLWVGTVIMGDPLNPPVFKAGSGFSGNMMIYCKDSYHDSTINFYIALKNIILDSTALSPSKQFTLLDWSVSQATQLVNLVFWMPNYSTGHTGIAMPEGGSGTYMGDLEFHGGAVGIDMSNQQYEVKSVKFNGCKTSIRVSHCFDCVFVNMLFTNGETGIDMTHGGSVGSVAVIDSAASNVGTVIAIASQSTGEGSLVIENLSVGSGVGKTVAADGQGIVKDSITEAWVYGNAYTAGGPSTGSHQRGTTYTTSRPSSLLQDGRYAVVAPPTYKEYDVSQFVNVKTVSDYPVRGDGSTDDTRNLNAIIAKYAGCKILFFPAGTYIVTNTLFFPAGSRVIGEVWSAISAEGDKFYNPDAPTPMVKVGNPGDKGIAQFSDMLFTVADVLQGCTLLEVNMAGHSPGDVGFWNSHFRVGGAAGSKVQTNCGGAPAQCKAAFMLMHLTAKSSAYVENMWGWTADHDLDGGHGATIATGRGILVEATTATWLHGTAFEHNTLYQYNFRNAANVFVGMQQSETPYWQGPGSPSLAPAPWTPNAALGDPDYSNCSGGDAKCRMAWMNYIHGSKDIFIYGSGFWTFFNHGDSGCQGSYCQANACDVGETTGLYWFNLNTHSNQNLIRNKGTVAVSQNDNPGSWGGVVAAFLTDI